MITPRIFAFRFQKEASKWDFAPAYDICHAYSPGNQWISKHAITINGKREDFVIEDLLQIAETIGCDKGRQIISKVSDINQESPAFSKN